MISSTISAAGLISLIAPMICPGILINLISLMWCYEVAADHMLLVMQLMIHKPGKAWTKRSAFRPISLCNDIYKVLDGCLYFYMARETGMIPEVVPGEELVRDPFIDESQRAYLRQRTTLDNILYSICKCACALVVCPWCGLSRSCVEESRRRVPPRGFLAGSPGYHNCGGAGRWAVRAERCTASLYHEDVSGVRVPVKYQ